MGLCPPSPQDPKLIWHARHLRSNFFVASCRCLFNIGHGGQGAKTSRTQTKQISKRLFDTVSSWKLYFFLHIVSVNRVCERFFGKGRWDGVVSFSNSATFVHDPGKQKQLLIEAHMDPSNDGCGRRAEPPIWHGRRATRPSVVEDAQKKCGTQGGRRTDSHIYRGRRWIMVRKVSCV